MPIIALALIDNCNNLNMREKSLGVRDGEELGKGPQRSEKLRKARNKKKKGIQGSEKGKGKERESRGQKKARNKKGVCFGDECLVMVIEVQVGECYQNTNNTII